jgi:ATP phosphoribosyltransferase
MVKTRNFDVELLLLRDDDIRNMFKMEFVIWALLERTKSLKKTLSLPVLRGLKLWKLSTSQWPHLKTRALVNPSDFEGKKIATSYPYLTKRFFEDQGISIEMVEISGAVEITPQLHVADAISDLVSTGGTLKANGLIERFTLLESETKLIQTQQALSEGKQQLIQKFLQRIDGYQTAKKSRYILMNAPLDSVETIKALLPSMKSPTIMPLA